MRETGLTTGCSTLPLKFCPWDKLPREQVAIFGLKLKYGKVICRLLLQALSSLT